MKVLQRLSSVAAACMLSFLMLLPALSEAASYTAVCAEIPVFCQEMSESGTHIYSIRIEPENDFSPAPRNDLLEIAENESGVFEIDITEPGTYTYRIYELSGNDPDVTYDDSLYTVTLFTENGDNDELVYSVFTNKTGSPSKERQIVFLDITETFTTATAVITTTTTITTTAVPVTTETTSLTTTAAVTSTSAATTPPAKKDNPITGIIDTVLTGDTFPAHAMRLAILLSVLFAVISFVLKRDKDEEDDPV